MGSSPRLRNITNDCSPRAEQSFSGEERWSIKRDIEPEIFFRGLHSTVRYAAPATVKDLKGVLPMSQEHKFKVVNNGQEQLREMSYRALRERMANRTRIFRSDNQIAAARSLDLTDLSQRVAQTRHLGKTIDDIPR